MSLSGCLQGPGECYCPTDPQHKGLLTVTPQRRVRAQMGLREGPNAYLKAGLWGQCLRTELTILGGSGGGLLVHLCGRQKCRIGAVESHHPLCGPVHFMVVFRGLQATVRFPKKVDILGVCLSLSFVSIVIFQ